MLETAVNSTHPAIAEIERVLNTYPYNPYQQAFTIPNLRQELIAYVLNQISLLNYDLPPHRLEQQRYLENLIHQGIYSILQENPDWVSRQLPQTEVKDSLEPSHWFG